MKLNILLSVNCLVQATFLSLFLLGSASPSLDHHQGKGSCADEYYDPEMTSTLGGLRDSAGGSAENSLEIESLGRFAVDEHNKKENSLLEFGRVLKSQDQVVAGTLHHLTIEATEGGKKKLYEAKVWEKPWMNFKELQEFKHVGDVTSFTSSDLGAMRGDPPQEGLMEVPVHDPEVQNAADHALKTIQQRSNSLVPYELQEVTHAKAERLDDSAKYHLGLRLKRGDKEENYNVEVHRKGDGNFHLNKMG